MKSLKSLKAVLIGFALLLTVTIVYAAGSGAMGIRGTVNITDVSLKVTSPDGSWNGTSGFLDFNSITLNDFTPSFTTTFTIENNGTQNAKITKFELGFDASEINVVISNPQGTGAPSVLALEAASTTNIQINTDASWTYTITITRAASPTLGAHNFDIEIVYTQA